MFCDECGHELDVNGVCPICGFRAVSQVANNMQGVPVQPQVPQPGMQSMPNMQQPNIPQGMQQRPQAPQGVPGQPMQGMQQNMQQPGMQIPNMGQPMQGIQQPGMQRPNMGQPMQGIQPNMQMSYGNNANQFGNMQLSTPTTAKKKKKWPIFLGIGIAVIAIVVAIILIIRAKDDDDDNERTTRETTERTTEATTEATTAEPVPSGEAGSRTILVYMVGSNLESKWGCASEDLGEMIAADVDDNVNIVAYTGGSFEWQNDVISDTENSYLLVKDGTLTLLDTEPAKNMGDPETLANFLNYGYENYPAEQYSVILWNHGGGVFWGYGVDELTDDYLTLAELTEAFDASPFKDNNKLEWLGFDACLMASVEIADAMSPYAKYLIASQESEPGWGWDYSFLNEIDSAPTGADIGKLVADHFIETTSNNFVMNPFSYCDITMSVMDLDKVGEVENALNNLFAQVSLDDSNYNKYSRIRSKTKEIANEFSGEQSYDVIDLMSFAKSLESMHFSEAVALESAIDDLVVYSNANEVNANGVSIYHPYNAKQYSTYYVPQYYQFGFAEEYAKYIAAFSTKLNGDTVVTGDWDVAGLVPYMTGNQLNFAVDLNEAQADAYQNAYYVISRADTEQPGNYIFVSMNNQVNMSGSTLTTAGFDGEIIYIRNNTTNDIYEVMYTEQEATEEYTRYLLTAILYNSDIQGDDAMYVYFVLEVTPTNPQGTIIGCYPLMNYIDTEGAEVFPDRYEIDINDYQNVAFGCVSHEFTSNEDLTNFNEADWSDATIWYNSFPISDGFSTTMDYLIPNMPYYGMFVIEDIQGNRHCSNIVQIQ